jgi:hypothetical protein
MTNESTPINAALDSDASQFFVGIRIRLLELGFGITLAPIFLASVEGRPEFWGTSDLLTPGNSAARLP